MFLLCFQYTWATCLPPTKCRESLMTAGMHLTLSSVPPQSLCFLLDGYLTGAHYLPLSWTHSLTWVPVLSPTILCSLGPSGPSVPFPCLGNPALRPVTKCPSFLCAVMLCRVLSFLGHCTPSKHCLGSARAQVALCTGHGMSSRPQLWELLPRQKEYGMQHRKELTEGFPGRQ